MDGEDGMGCEMARKDRTATAGRKEIVSTMALYKARICLMENSYSRLKQFRTIPIR